MKRQSSKLWFIAAAFFAVLLSPAHAQQTVLPAGAVWKYWDTGTLPDPNWTAPGYDDALWLSGPAELGFGDGGETTMITAGSIAYYFRTTFPLADASSVTNFRARLKRDDGAVVYINGVEVFRDNMPAGPIDASTGAATTATDDGQTFIAHNFVASGLVNGDNVIAVEVHQVNTASSDVSFDLELIANPLPSIAISSPTNNQTIASASVGISGSALIGGTNISSIQLFANGVSIGAPANNANFSYNWQNVIPGSYTLTATIVDSSGLRATSAPVSVTVQAAPASMLIPRNSSWVYNNLNQDILATAWNTLAYDDSAWLGPVPAPIGDNNEAGVQLCTTVIDIGPATSRYPAVFYRKKFNVSSAASYQGLTIRVQRDDFVVVYLNGVKLINDGVPEPLTFTVTGGTAAAGATEVAFTDYPVPSTALVNGQNVIAVANYQQATGSSDLQFDLELEGNIDVNAPVVVAADPTQGGFVRELNFISVEFSEAVTGVNASDLLINSEPATNMSVINPKQYTFYFPTPPTGTVQVAFAPTHGITDLAPVPNAFAGGSWTYNFNSNIVQVSSVILSEFMANNNSGIKDDDSSRQDWIELYNPGPLEQNMLNWTLSDDTNNIRKWVFPAVLIQPNSYMIVWASAKDRRDPTHPLHTNFRLGSSAGGNLILADAGTNIISTFLNYPAQTADISYGRDKTDASIVGYFQAATPGAQNATEGTGFATPPVFSYDSGVYTNDTLIISMTSPMGGAIRYTTDGTIPTNTSTTYSGPISITGNTTIKARVYPPNGLFPSTVIAKQYILLDATVASFYSKIPLLVLDARGNIPQDVIAGGTRAKGNFAVFDTQGGRSRLMANPDHIGPAEFEIFGQTSAGFPKKPFNIECQDALGNDKDVSVLGLPADADWKLRNPYSDKCMINDFLAYELFEQMGNYSCRRRLVEVFVHQGTGKLTMADYHGIESLFEKIEISGHRVDLQKTSPLATNEPAITGGYIFKKDKDSAGDLNFGTSGFNGFGGQGLKMHDPKPRELLGGGNNPQVLWLQRFLNRAEVALYTNTWLTQTGTNHYSYYFDQDAFVEQFWIVEFPKQIDGYRLSDYFSKERSGKVRPVPIWDWNLSFGNADYLDGGHFSNWYWNQTGFADHPWAKRMITGNSGNTGIGDPDFCQKIADRWAVLRTNILNNTRLLGRIDELNALLEEAAQRDFAKFPRLGTYIWPNPSTPAFDMDYVRPTTYDGIIVEMKKWVNGRYLWIDSLFTRNPVFSQSGSQVTSGTTITLTAPTGGSTIYYTLNGTDPRASGGGVAAGALTYSGPITINGNVQITARAKTLAGGFQGTWSGPAKETFFTGIPDLRITEIMYHPSNPGPGNTNDPDNFEYIEVQNTGSTPLNLNRFTLSGGVTFNFPNVVLAAGQSGVIVADTNAFISRYGSGILILGTYTGHLANSGDHLVLSGSAAEPILDFSYSDSWYLTTDGPGFSLVIQDPNGPLANWNSAAGWRPSAGLNGSPGAVDPAPPARPGIVVNEVRTFSDPTPDAIELYNPTGGTVNIGGWFLTDDVNIPTKFVIPPGTTIQSGTYMTFTETSFNANTNDPNSFAFDGEGDSVVIFSGDGINLTGYAKKFDFGASEAGVTFGRYIDSQGEDHFVRQISPTIGTANSGPAVGPVVISEIHYHPTDLLVSTNGLENKADEFIELQNITGSPVNLYDTSNTWHLREAVDFNFPPNTSIPANGYILVVGFDPSDSVARGEFQSRMGVSPATPIYGPWSGALENGGATIELRKPRTGDTNGVDVLVERVQYKDSAPWPTAADGVGLTLQRVVASSYGNDPTNWVAAGPTPGSAATGGSPPVITGQPSGFTAISGTDVNLTVSATGSNLRYQWRYQGQPLPGATNSTLSITNFQLSKAGVYNVLVFNGGGSILGTNFTVHGRTLLRITSQPQHATNVVLGTSTNFTVVAEGLSTDPAFNSPPTYQWYFGVNPIPGGNGATLTITNVQFPSEGDYYVVIQDAYGVIVTSDIAHLTPVAKPGIVFQPIGITAVEGGNAYFSIVCTGSVPMTIRWRASTNNGAVGFLNGLPVLSGGTNSVLMWNNIPYTTNTYRISAIITNVAGQAPVSAVAILTVLKDSDHDGLPDIWETNHVGFSTNNAADGAQDLDGDGMSNSAEYVAGTDYTNAASVLKVLMTNGVGRISFQAVTNRTYSVLYRDSFDPADSWKKLGDVFSRNVNRTETMIDRNATTNRYYRVVIPIQP